MVQQSFLTLIAILLLTRYEIAAQHEPTPITLGHSVTMHSMVLHEDRILNIYLPDGYEQNDSTQFPVIYLLDGSIDEDFVHVAGLLQYNTLSWIDRVPPSILVGIANVDRRRDFSYPTTLISDQKLFPTTGGSSRFIQFLETELQPFIEKHYKAGGVKTIIGQSLGGLLATEILFRKPEMFDQYIIISPSLWWDDGSLLKYNAAILKAGYTKPTNIYIGVGKEGITPGERPHVMEVDANILADMIQNSPSRALRLHFDYLPQENHATISHQAISNAIIALHLMSR